MQQRKHHGACPPQPDDQPPPPTDTIAAGQRVKHGVVLRDAPAAVRRGTAFAADACDPAAQPGVRFQHVDRDPDCGVRAAAAAVVALGHDVDAGDAAVDAAPQREWRGLALEWDAAAVGLGVEEAEAC